jgi:N-carbamoyl-D-amino-acid hydrolase
MSRSLVLAAAQMGPVSRNDTREAVVDRLVALLRRASERGCQWVVFPELALTTFFPRLDLEDQDEIDSFFEKEMPGPATRRLFEAAAALRVGFYLGYGELCTESGEKRRFNSSILVSPGGDIIGKYRKIHIPGIAAKSVEQPRYNFEKRYFHV